MKAARVIAGAALVTGTMALVTGALAAGSADPALAATADHPRPITTQPYHPAPRHHGHHARRHSHQNAPQSPAVVFDCAGQPQRRPRYLWLSCGDSTDLLYALRWTDWRRGRAAAAGIQEINDCAPDCATGEYHAYHVQVTLTGAAAVAGQPRARRYTAVRVRYPGQRPGIARTVTYRL